VVAGAEAFVEDGMAAWREVGIVVVQTKGSRVRRSGCALISASSEASETTRWGLTSACRLDA
jgi:hypothetical protein